MRAHDDHCNFATALRCPVGIPCKHDFDVCPKCDACTCGAGTEPLDYGAFGAEKLAAVAAQDAAKEST